eukprot:CAMPEP_0184649126 /NCGR_PEP_ID=MMETSP0308-20130426/6397_1 /TAXON_ID=38269 /ORGANISM="Gloeochaete witrockiana, Strain SAG 46.84" /LENGTH=55 /DNA_ID=CAMNT_0027081561 /DNA_START=1 /DNA_END=171 /DNA_ORIENTATION=+
MDGWVDGWMGGWVDGWMEDRQTDDWGEVNWNGVHGLLSLTAHHIRSLNCTAHLTS